MDSINFYTNIEKGIADEALRYPLHLRGNHLALLCKVKALDILHMSGIDELVTPMERHVLSTKVRYILKSAMAMHKFDFDTLMPDTDETALGDNLNRVVERLVRSISIIHSTGVINGEESISEDFRHDFCKSLLWLCSTGLGVNQDLFDDYFKSKVKLKL